MSEHTVPEGELHQTQKVDGSLISGAELSDLRSQGVLADLDDFAMRPTTPEGTMGGVARVIAEHMKSLEAERPHMTTETAIRALNSLHRLDYYWHMGEPAVTADIQAFIDVLKQQIYGTEEVHPEATIKHIGGEAARSGERPGVAVVGWEGSPIYTYLTSADANPSGVDSRPQIALTRNSHKIWVAKVGREEVPIPEEGVTFGRDSFPELKQTNKDASQEISRSHIFVRVDGDGMLEIHDTSMNGTTVETRGYPEPAEVPVAVEQPRRALAGIRDRLKRT